MYDGDGPKTLGEIVRTAREQSGLTQVELADRVGRTQVWVGKVERGVIPTPKDESLQRLAGALNLNVADLFVAMNRARTPHDAARIAESLPAYDPHDPVAFVCDLASRVDWSRDDRLGTVTEIMQRWSVSDRKASRP